jgi:hypothetical protein
MPGPKELLAIRNHIAANPTAFRRILATIRLLPLVGCRATNWCAFPKGLRQITRLPLASLQTVSGLGDAPPEMALGTDLLPLLVQTFRTLLPLVRFLNAPLKPGKREMMD